MITQPPERSSTLFVLLTGLALLIAAIDAAVRARLSPRGLLRAGWTALLRGLRRWRADRHAAAAALPALEHTVGARLAWPQLAAELALIVLVTAAVTQPYLNLSPATQLPGVEAEWLTSSAHFAANSLREYGYLPLWQPYLEFGEPLIDNPFSFVLNPISAGPSLLLGGVVGIKLSVVLSAWVAGLGGWALGRVLGFGALGRLLLAALLIGKGNMHAMIGAGYYQLGVSQAYLPWVVAGGVATLRLPDRRWPVVLTALSFTLLFWAGNIWYTLPALLSLGLLALAHLTRGDGRGINGAGLRRLALAGALTLGLSAITLLPIWLQRGQIGSHPNDLPGGRAVDLGSVIGQFFDVYLKGGAPGAAHFYYSFVTPLWFAVVVLILIPPVWPYLHRPRLPQAWRIWLPGAALIVLATLWGAGGNPIFAWLYQHIPLLGQWRFVGRALGAASFWIAILVALRVDGLWQAMRQPGWLARLAGASPRLRRGLVYGLAGALIVASAAAAQQVLVKWHTLAGTIGINVYDDLCLRWLREQHPGEELAVYRVNYDAITPFLTYQVRLVNVEADFTPLPQPATLGRNFDLTASLPAYAIAWTEATRTHVAARGYVPDPESPAPVDQNHCLWRLPGGALPYAYRLTLPALEAAQGGLLDPARITPIETFRRYPDTIVVAVTADQTDPLVVTIQERAYPGWQVSVDGNAARLDSVGGQVGVVLPPDGAPHAITFAYRPPLLYLGGAITLITWAGCVLYLLGADRALLRRRMTFQRNTDDTDEKDGHGFSVNEPCSSVKSVSSG